MPQPRQHPRHQSPLPVAAALQAAQAGVGPRTADPQRPTAGAQAPWNPPLPELLSACINAQFSSNHGAGEARGVLWGGGPGACACLGPPGTTCLAQNRAHHAGYLYLCVVQLEDRLLSAIRAGDLDTALAVLKAGAAVEAAGSDGSNPLHHAAMAGDIDMALVLLKGGAWIEARDSGGCTALVHAADGGHTSLVLALRQKGAEVNTVDHFGCTALHHAARGGHTDTVMVLLAAGAAVGVASDSKRRTPLHEAASGGHTGMARALVRGGACLDACDSHGCTPLHLAACQGHRDTARVLLPSYARLAESAADGEFLVAVRRPAHALAAAPPHRCCLQSHTVQGAWAQHACTATCCMTRCFAAALTARADPSICVPAACAPCCRPAWRFGSISPPCRRPPCGSIWVTMGWSLTPMKSGRGWSWLPTAPCSRWWKVWRSPCSTPARYPCRQVPAVCWAADRHLASWQHTSCSVAAVDLHGDQLLPLCACMCAGQVQGRGAAHRGRQAGLCAAPRQAVPGPGQ